MFKIVDDVIYITRGDDAAFNIASYLDEERQHEYTLHEGDYYTLTVRKVASKESEVVLSVVSTTGRIFITHNDSDKLEVGKYSADIQLYVVPGDIRTVWPKFDVVSSCKEYNFKNFCVMPEVTSNE